MTEQDPSLKDPETLRYFAGWLVSQKAKLDAGPTHGNVATRLLVEDTVNRGHWAVQLAGGIDMVNSTDLGFATQDPAHIVYMGPVKDRDARVEVYYSGVDGETRSADLDTKAPLEFFAD